MALRAALCACLAGLACLLSASGALARPVFRPRVGAALGLIPPINSHGQISAADVASGAQTPVVYHGGQVMTGDVTVHTVFWGPAGSFQGSPAAGVPSYEGLIEQFFADVAHDSGSGANVFSVLPQFGEGTMAGSITPGEYRLSYDSAAPGDMIGDGDAYPRAGQCASPNGIVTCLTDTQVQTELAKVIARVHGARGLHDLWFVFLPPNVDECITAGDCGSNDYAAYHAASSTGADPTVYAVAIDPIIEVPVTSGSDPEGNPDAESTIDGAAHETVEAMTDPLGVGWMDPNGYEVADKCETGPDTGVTLGFAGPDHAPYNQVIDGHPYLIQDMWSNDDGGCVQSTTRSADPLPLPQVALTQFSSVIRGDIGRAARGVRVTVTLLRAGASGRAVPVAAATARTGASGRWSLSLAPHAVGDDRDEIAVDYSGAGAPKPLRQVILTGNGGDPVDESGWIGWIAMDNGSRLGVRPRPSLSLGPCSQTGVLSASVLALAPIEFCNTETDVATEPVGGPIGPRTAASWSSNDNRAFSPPDAPHPNPLGGLVKLTVPIGEPRSVSLFDNPLDFFDPGGFPTCTAELQAQRVSCAGLVPKRSYSLRDGRRRGVTRADGSGTLSAPLRIRQGDRVVLSNGVRSLTTLHVARLRVDISGAQTVLAGGRCEPGEYYGAALRRSKVSSAAGEPTDSGGGLALTGEICPLTGRAGGLPSGEIAQTDERSGGLTRTEVPALQGVSPADGENVYGAFTAVARTYLPGPHGSRISTDRTTRVELSIVPGSGGRARFRAGNVDTTGGVSVRSLPSGLYRAVWTLVDANGDTRTVTTRFAEQG